MECTYSGPGDSPVYLPASGSNGPAAYTPSNVSTGAPPRQYSASTHVTPLAIPEVMYNPPPRGDGKDLEFIEIMNSEPVDINIGGYCITGDVSYTFASNYVLRARSMVVVAKDPAASAG